MLNTRKSSRATSWRFIIAHSGFRAGFADVRAGLGFRPEFERRSSMWCWHYELGRLFAAGSFSRRWKGALPSKVRDVSPTLVEACAAAQRAQEIPS